MSTPAALAQERREECRRDVLGHLAERQAVAQHPASIRRGLNAGHAHDYTDEEVAAALAFLAAMEPARAKSMPEPMGSTLYWQATAAGVLAHERGN